MVTHTPSDPLREPHTSGARDDTLSELPLLQSITVPSAQPLPDFPVTAAPAPARPTFRDPVHLQMDLRVYHLSKFDIAPYKPLRIPSGLK